VSVPHFFVEDLRADLVTLSEDDTRHALRSLRLRLGDTVSLADGAGTVGLGRLRETGAGLAGVEVEERHRVVRPRPMISVALAPPKGDRLSWAVQKLAEVGVDEAVLIRTERSVRAWSEERTERGLARLRAVAREAAMQSRRPFVMEIRPPATLEEAVHTGSIVVALWEGATDPLTACLSKDSGRIRLVVGPEGGFEEREVDAMRRAGAALASLGQAILRTETAAVVGAALVLARYGRLG
jgi:16S rRNA (uracil1498-N3)-methyltransferase